MKESTDDIEELKRKAALLAREEAKKRLEEMRKGPQEKALSKTGDMIDGEDRKQTFEEAKQRVLKTAAKRIEAEERVAEEDEEVAEKKRRAAEEAKERAKEIAAQKALQGGTSEEEKAKAKAAAAAKVKAAALAKKKASEGKGASEEEKAKAKAAAAAKAKAAALAKKKEAEGKGASEEEKAKVKAAAAAKAKAAALAKKKAAEGKGASEEEKAKAIAAAKAKAAAAAKAKASGEKEENTEEETVKPSINQPYLDRYVRVITENFGGDVLEASYINLLSKDVPTLVIKLEHYYEVMTLLKSHEELAFNYMSELHATDFVTHMEVYVHLFSYGKKQSLAVKVKLDREAPKVSSIVPLWSGADWPEREAYDLLGVTFEGHPNLKRIMMPDDWVGHPLRKDYEPFDMEL